MSINTAILIVTRHIKKQRNIGFSDSQIEGILKLKGVRLDVVDMAFLRLRG